MSALARWVGVAVLLLGSVQSASAQLSTADSSFGANSLVVDARTGLSWLQLSSATGLTVDEVSAAAAHDWTFQSGVYAGYRVATVDEVSALIDAYVRCFSGPCGFVYSSTGTNNPAYVVPAFGLISLFGGDIEVGSDGRFLGVMSGLTTTYRNVSLWASVDPTGPSFTVNADRFAGFNGTAFMIAPVPEPSTYALMLVGLAAIGVAVRRRMAALQL